MACLPHTSHTTTSTPSPHNSPPLAIIPTHHTATSTPPTSHLTTKCYCSCIIIPAVSFPPDHQPSYQLESHRAVKYTPISSSTSTPMRHPLKRERIYLTKVLQPLVSAYSRIGTSLPLQNILFLILVGDTHFIASPTSLLLMGVV